MERSGTYHLDERVFRLLVELVRERTGLHFDRSRHEMVEDRLGRRVAELDLPGFLDYYYHLRYGEDGGAEFDHAVEALTVNETYFFRETGPLETLLTGWLPELGRPCRIWSSACASGEEPYTLAMLARRFGVAGSLELAASDIDRTAVARAREARYRESSFRATPPEVRRACFEGGEPGNRLVEPIRNRVRFFRANVLDPGPAGEPGSWEVILCRNLLIYFTDETCRRVLDGFHRALVPGGLLLVGVAESLLRLDTPFEPVERDGWFYYRKVEE